MRIGTVCCLFLGWCTPTFAGLYLTCEPRAELPSAWRGFLVDHRNLRMIAVVTPNGGTAASLRERYSVLRAELEAKAAKGGLSAAETAELGGLLLRLGEPANALDVLRRGQARFGDDWRFLCNLATAWQANNELARAAATLEEALEFVPSERRPFEELHLRLLRQRLRDAKGADGLDDLFGISWSDAKGKPTPGTLSKEASAKLPTNAAALLQDLALSLPADGRLLWQLGELANAFGDVRTAANILEGCVAEFGMGGRELRERRKVYREAAEALHAGREHANKPAGTLAIKSQRPILRRFSAAAFPKVKPDGINELPWLPLAETTIENGFKPMFSDYLKELNGKRVSLTGFMQPLSEDLQVGAFLLIEYPVGCWFCETPEPTALLYVQLPEGKSVPVRRGQLRVVGTLTLNTGDPEDFLYSLTDASIGGID